MCGSCVKGHLWDKPQSGTGINFVMQLYTTFKMYSSVDKQFKFLIVHMWCIPYITLYHLFSLMCSHMQEVNPVIDLLSIMVLPVRFISCNPPVQRVDVTSLELSLCASKFTYFTQFYANIRAPEALDQHITWERDKEGERGRERIWPWLLIHNSHCLLHTFQNSFRLWR